MMFATVQHREDWTLASMQLVLIDVQLYIKESMKWKSESA